MASADPAVTASPSSHVGITNIHRDATRRTHDRSATSSRGLPRKSLPEYALILSLSRVLTWLSRERRSLPRRSSFQFPRTSHRRISFGRKITRRPTIRGSTAASAVSPSHTHYDDEDPERSPRATSSSPFSCAGKHTFTRTQQQHAANEGIPRSFTHFRTRASLSLSLFQPVNRERSVDARTTTRSDQPRSVPQKSIQLPNSSRHRRNRSIRNISRDTLFPREGTKRRAGYCVSDASGTTTSARPALRRAHSNVIEISIAPGRLSERWKLCERERDEDDERLSADSTGPVESAVEFRPGGSAPASR
ncbi:PREDICTED: uncharacterized protein LOC106741505 [Dinoponera quadriceps]|uniref:Uncharacterized protein LOC106741505 n=1 Tax=Dinoponera quadriceps TaxID=609295 RepID=A0A6P3WSM6_DINQU|nr:PREDICTED: uncharacterized protein LOC106741505 [Dinoponera quadriceps]